MKLIKWLAIWLSLGLAALAFAANAVAVEFAAYFAKPVLGVCLVLGLLFGISGQIRRGKEKRRIAAELEYLAGSHEQRKAWGEDLQQRSRQIWNKCQENTSLDQENPMFQPEYRAEQLLDRINAAVAETEALQSNLRAAVLAMEEEG
jgi:hypothetical protein